jgi:hypothetical protein
MLRKEHIAATCARKLVDYDLPLDKASNEDLERVWNEIFAKAYVKTIVLTEFIETTKLLELWIQSTKTHLISKH